MLEEFLKYLSVYMVSMVKFFGGPVAGISLGLSYIETVMLTIAGMMTSVVVFSFAGRAAAGWLSRRRISRNKPVFSRKNRNIVKIWKRFGIKGVAFLTPVLLTPVIGTIVAALFGAPRKNIIINMLWSSVIWSFALTFVAYKFRQLFADMF